ncbi:hypothetical protein EIP86_009325 [Pleurotus ostreatoroseus]|nr:hypothetical protein EIP86_009325 [Pleurotus ostreatoroseus]
MDVTIDEHALLNNGRTMHLDEQVNQTTIQSEPSIVQESLTTQQGLTFADQSSPLDEQEVVTDEQNRKPSCDVHQPVTVAAELQLGSAKAMSSSYRRLHKDMLIESEDIKDMLYYRYGFHNASMSDTAEPDDMLSWLEVERLFGIADDKEHIPAEMQPAVQVFVSSLLNEGHPTMNLCDLFPRSPHPNPIDIIKQHLEVIKVDGGWKIFLPRASTLFEIARRGCYKNKSEIVAELLARGQPFRTVQEAPALADSVVIPPIIQKHLTPATHEFSFEDYLMYEERRDSLLKQPRGRAALMKGGIVWRLALEVLSEEHISFAKIPEGFMFNMNIGDKCFVDDELTESELDVIVGVNYVPDAPVLTKSQEEHHGRRREADEPGKMAKSFER